MGTRLSRAQEEAVRWFVEALRKDIGQAANPPVNGRTLACLERDGYVVRVWTSARGEGWQATNKATVWVEDRDFFAAKARQDEWDTAVAAARDAEAALAAEGTATPQAFIPDEAAESIHTYRGVRFLVTITPDPYTMPEDYGVTLESLRTAWRRGEWRYVAVTVALADMPDLRTAVGGVPWGTLPDLGRITLDQVVAEYLPSLAPVVIVQASEHAARLREVTVAWESVDAAR